MNSPDVVEAIHSLNATVEVSAIAIVAFLGWIIIKLDAANRDRDSKGEQR